MSSNTAPSTAPATSATTAPNDELTAAVDKLALSEDSATTSAAPALDPTTTLPTSSTPDPNPWRTMTPSIPPTTTTETLPSESTTPNPWQAPTPMLPQEPSAVADPATLDPELRNSAAAFGGAQKTVTTEQEKEILAAFDPYARVESEEQRKAWDDARTSQDGQRKDDDTASISKAEAGAEGEPPATPSEADAPPEPPSKTHTPSSSASGFPSLNFSSIARSFSISSLNKDKGRPVSLDAKAQPDNVDARTVSQEQQDSGQQGDESRPSNEGNTAGTAQNAARQEDGEPPPFDFQKFLEQMNSKSAEPVSKYLKSFLSNFAKRTFTVNDQIKIINDFLNFIAQRMRQTDPWRKCTEQEFDNAMEGMEKLVMNRLYDFTFTPSIPTLQPPRPVTTDDLERDRVLAQRIALFGWVEEKHLDIDLTSEEGDTSSAKGFLMFAQQELLKMNHYKAPRDKVICILNCCKVIFGLIRHLKKDESADAFIPLLIFVVLKANPEHLLSNMEFIQRFRNPAKLQSEAGYYLSSLMGAVSFIETMDHTSLSNITQEEFEKNVEQAIQSLPRQEQSPPLPSSGPPSGWSTPTHQRTPSALSERPRSSSMASLPPRPPSSMSAPSSPLAAQIPTNASHAGEESATPLSLPSIDIADDARRLFQKTGDTISKPLSAIGRIFSEVVDGVVRPDSPPPPQGGPSWAHPDQVRQYIVGSGASRPQTPTFAQGQPPIQTPYKPRVRRVQSPAAYAPGHAPVFVGADETPSRPPQSSNSAPSFLSQATQFLGGTPPRTPPPRTPPYSVSRTPTPGLDIAGVQAQIDLATQRAAEANQATLMQIFPGMDREVVQLVLEANENDVGKSIEKLLEMTAGS